LIPSLALVGTKQVDTPCSRPGRVVAGIKASRQRRLNLSEFHASLEATRFQFSVSNPALKGKLIRCVAAHEISPAFQGRVPGIDNLSSRSDWKRQIFSLFMASLRDARMLWATWPGLKRPV